ncbi:Protein fam72a [Mortierella sp. GBA30]|nr:Protein fam72a [Mortierella sp. GBA30]
MPNPQASDSSSTNRGSQYLYHNHSRNLNTQRPSPDVDFGARFSEFIRSTRRNASSEHPVIETFVDNNEDYQSLLTAVSNIHMSRSQHIDSSHQNMDHNQQSSDGPENSTSTRVPHGPYLVQEAHDARPDERTLSRMDEDSEEGYMNRSNSDTEDLYDLQHIMIHNQRQFEDQMRRAREDYDRSQETEVVVMNDVQDRTAGPRLDPSQLETSIISSSIVNPFSTGTAEESENANGVEAHLISAEQYAASTVHPRPTISSSYFSPTTESTIVLSSPPPGRTANTFSHGSSVNANLHSTIPSHSGATTNIGIGLETTVPHVANRPYRPFTTGRNLSTPQRYWQQGQVPTGDVALSENQLDQYEGRILEGENTTGHWSIYGAMVQPSRSFEEHRYRYYRQQQQQQQRLGSGYHHLHHPNQSMEDVSSVNEPITASDRSRMTAGIGLNRRPNPMLPQSQIQLNQRGGTHPSNRPYQPLQSGGYPMRSSSIPIPLRYINPQQHPFSHPQYMPTQAPSSSPYILRPQNIMTGATHYSNNEYSRPRSGTEQHEQQALGAGAPIRRRVVANGPSAQSTSSYSETVERAEAGGFDHPSTSFAVEPFAYVSSWQDDPIESRGRHNIGLKEVVRMACRFCETIICERGMKAQLLADQSVALLSTDDSPQSVQLIGTDYRPTNCYCKIRDTACLVCASMQITTVISGYFIQSTYSAVREWILGAKGHSCGESFLDPTKILKR